MEGNNPSELFLRQDRMKTQVVGIIKDYLKNNAFTTTKITDTPHDALEVVNRRFVTANGATASIPPTSVIGQFYFNTSTNIPMWWDGTKWRNGVGSVVA